MGIHNKKRKRGMKYHIINLRLNEVEWGFLQSIKEKGISMSEYIRTTMKTTPRYQDYMKVLYGNHRDEFSKLLPRENTKPSLPTDKWNSVNVEMDILKDLTGIPTLTTNDVIGSAGNPVIPQHKLVSGDVNSNRVIKSQDSIPYYYDGVGRTTNNENGSQSSKIDKRYE